MYMSSPNSITQKCQTKFRWSTSTSFFLFCEKKWWTRKVLRASLNFFNENTHKNTLEQKHKFSQRKAHMHACTNFYLLASRLPNNQRTSLFMTRAKKEECYTKEGGSKTGVMMKPSRLWVIPPLSLVDGHAKFGWGLSLLPADMIAVRLGLVVTQLFLA